MNKNIFVKASAAIFVFLALIISLFPPYEFGNEKIRTLSERRLNRKIIEKLPIKSYDFIISSNKKYFPLDHYNFTKKFYDQDSIKYYEDLWGDKLFSLHKISVDTFLTASGILYKSEGPMPDGYRKNTDVDPSFYRTHGVWENPLFKTRDDSREKNRVIKYEISDTDGKKEYEKSPRDWGYKYVYKFDSSKKYYEFTITQPVYYLLNREILLSELIIEYTLAFLISAVVGFIPRFFYYNKMNSLER